MSGKDSLVMALLLQEREPELPLEYVYVDTGVEHPTTYDFMEAVRALIPGLITLNPPRSWEELLTARGGFLPSARGRWCTQELKVNPIQRYIAYGQDDVTLYIGLRADEEGRLGALTRKNELVRYPLREYGIGLQEVRATIRRAGIALPERRGCYLCWGQKRWEWVQLGEQYPELFAKASEYEQLSTCSEFTFVRGLSLPELWKRRGRILGRANKARESRRFPEWEGENDDGDSVCRIWCR